jgi:hypothetical protein
MYTDPTTSLSCINSLPGFAFSRLTSFSTDQDEQFYHETAQGVIKGVGEAITECLAVCEGGWERLLSALYGGRVLQEGRKMQPQQGSWVSSKAIGVGKAEDTTSLPCSGPQG